MPREPGTVFGTTWLNMTGGIADAQKILDPKSEAECH